jgi:hypothetical protein
MGNYMSIRSFQSKVEGVAGIFAPATADENRRAAAAMRFAPSSISCRAL